MARARRRSAASGRAGARGAHGARVAARDATPAIFARRRAGTLLHLSSLPGGHGIGDLGPQAHAFADWCAAAGQSIWQMLPVGPVGPGDSPYASTSSFAGEPLFVSLELLVQERLLPRAALHPARGERAPAAGPRADYAGARRFKEPRFHAAYDAFRRRGGLRSRGFRAFERAHGWWLRTWCAFAAASGGAQDPRYHAFLQFEFDRQWSLLRAHCAARGVLLLGDVPIFVPLDSADVRADPRLFRLDRDGRPEVLTGVPPDCFSTTGQLWGHPHYRWSEHRRTGFAWWIARIRESLRRFDALRIDHFVGFVHAYEIPGGARDARRGRWRPTPGRELLEALERACGRLPLVAEDLGAVTPEVTALRERFGLPGMKLLHNAFYGPDSGDLPPNHPLDCVAYPGTHDNDTTVGWWRGLSAPARARFADYTGARTTAQAGREVCPRIVQAALQSPARTAIVAMQDHLGLGRESRMNTPGKGRGQWRWRLAPGALDRLDAASIRRSAEATARA
ncbi:MAG: 4-alpha-glucanotransferase [Phycisphaerales bacterium]